MNIYAATAILFLSSAQAQQIQSPTAALTTFVPTEGSNDELVVVEELQPMSLQTMSLQTAQIIEAFGNGSTKSSKTGGHGYGGYDPKSKSAKGSGYGVTQIVEELQPMSLQTMSLQTAQIIEAFGNGSTKSSKTGGHGYGGYDPKSKSAKDSGYGVTQMGYAAANIESTKGGNGSSKGDKGDYGYDSKSAKGSGYGVTQAIFFTQADGAAAVEVEETSAPDVDEIVGYLSSLLTKLLDGEIEGQADAVEPATIDIDAVYEILEYFLNGYGYGSKSSKAKSGKRF